MIKLVVLDANFYWTQQLFSACAEFAEVLLLRPYDFRAFRNLYGSYFVDWQPRAIAPHVWEQRICCPPGWLFHYWRLTRQYFIYLIKRFQGNDPLIFVFNYPYYSDLIQLCRAFSIYYVTDDYSSYWSNKQAQTQYMERQSVLSTNLVICISLYRAKYLQTTYHLPNHQVTHLPIGCSPQFMVKEPLHKPKPLPVALQRYQQSNRAIAGYIGTLSYRFDFAYLATVAQLIPEITILLGGALPSRADGSAEWWQGVEQVQQLPNVHFIGTVPHDCLGEYLQSFDVLLMIYSQCEFNLNSCPTKLWDYMGTSLPIVSNDVVPEVNLWHEVVAIAHSPIQFAHYVQVAVNGGDRLANQRLEIARQHTWQQQAHKLKGILQERGALR